MSREAANAWAIQRADQTTEPMQFVSDLRDVATPNSDLRRLTDPVIAAELITIETRLRLEAIFEKDSGPPVVLLSGGVDSIFVAAMARSIGARPHAITVVTEGDIDEVNATAAAEALDMSHELIRLDATALVELARAAISGLGTSELWEVAAAIPLLVVSHSLDDRRHVGPVLTGSGADAILAGGRILTHPIASEKAVDELDRVVRKESATNFTYRRLVPHFHSVVMGKYESRLFHIFQTLRFWELSETFAPPVLFTERNGRLIDKLCLRIACDQLLEDSVKNLAWNQKSPIQRSSGIMRSLAAAARRCAADLPGARTYSDPATESFDAVATRLYLALLGNRCV